MKNQSLKSNKGFSLVELIVVIAIMAILVGIMAPSLMKQINKSRLSKDTNTLDTLAQGIVNALAEPDAYEEFKKPASFPVKYSAIMDNTGYTDENGDGKDNWKEEISDYLKGKAATDIKFSSKDYKGLSAADVDVYLDANENVYLVLTSSSDSNKKIYNPSKKEFDKAFSTSSSTDGE